VVALAASESNARALSVKLEVALPSADFLLNCVVDQAAIVAEAISLEPLVLRTAASAALELSLVLGISPFGGYRRYLDTRVSILCRLPVNLVN